LQLFLTAPAGPLADAGAIILIDFVLLLKNISL
jgi:hypothetical protein